MNLQFERTVDDYVAFTKVYMKRSRKWQRQRLVSSLLLGIGIAAFLALKGAPLNISAVIAVVLTLGFFAVNPWLHCLSSRSTYKRNKATLGEAELEVVRDGIIGRKGNHELKTAWGGIGDIVTEGEHTFIYIDEKAAHIIPHRRITSGNYVLFMQELARQIEAHTLAPLATPSIATAAIPVGTPLRAEAEQTEIIPARHG